MPQELYGILMLFAFAIGMALWIRSERRKLDKTSEKRAASLREKNALTSADMSPETTAILASLAALIDHGPADTGAAGDSASSTLDSSPSVTDSSSF